MTVEDLLLRYLAAFGPSTVRDMQSWSGLTRLRDVVDSMKRKLSRLSGPDGAELFDVPGAPLPESDELVPVRFLPEFDNILLAHHDRSRIIREEFRRHVYSVNGLLPSTVLVDGFVRGRWRILREKNESILSIERFDRWSPDEIAAVKEEGAGLLRFAATNADAKIRIAAVAS
jgi:hypothetical protein